METMERAQARGRAQGLANGIPARLARLKAEDPGNGMIAEWEGQLRDARRTLASLEAEEARDRARDRRHLGLAAAAVSAALASALALLATFPASWN